MGKYGGGENRHRRYGAGRQERSAERSAEPESGAERPPLGDGPAGERGARGGKRGKVRYGLVRVHDQAERSDEDEHGAGSRRAAFGFRRPVARGGIDEPERAEDERAACEARRGVQRQEARQGLGENER